MPSNLQAQPAQSLPLNAPLLPSEEEILRHINDALRIGALDRAIELLGEITKGRGMTRMALKTGLNFSGKDVCIRVTAVDLSLLTGEPFSSGLSCSFSSGNHAFTPVADGKFHLAASSRILRQHICRRILARSR